MSTQKIDESELVVFNVYRRLRKIIRDVEIYRDRIARNFCISGAALYVLISIYDSSECSFKDLAADLGLAPNTVSSLASTLVERELVTVTTDPLDRRIGRLRVTEKGKNIVEEAWTLSQTDAEDSCAELKSRVLSQLHDFCQTLPNNGE